ncbi:MAG: CpaF family protein [Methanobacteriaceae archaeon]|nr:CpaF family protein [Methanobacteriaceae archaeon]
MFYSINYDDKNKNLKRNNNERHNIRHNERHDERNNGRYDEIHNERHDGIYDENNDGYNKKRNDDGLLKSNPKTYLSDKSKDKDYFINKEGSKDLVPKYKVSKPNFSKMELNALEELRENIVDLAISENMSSFNEKLILEDVNRFLMNRFPNLDDINRKILANNMFQELIGYGEIDSLIKDDDLEEIMVIGVGKPVFVYHREHGMMETDLIFENEDKILRIIDSIAREANRRIDQQSPILDARMKDGSRINATIAPLSADGPTLTIRKFKKDPLTIIDLIKFNTLDTEIAAFFWLTIDGLGVKPANIIISGGTSSGKTTLLNALSVFINPKERIITIEDTLELQFYHKHIVRMEARSVNIENQGEITIEDLVKNSLRQRPDRIIIGEVRGSEAITLFTALNTGHSGFGTLHANNSRETISRLIHAPMSVPKIMISSIDYIVMEKRIYKSDGKSFRRITEIDEVVGMEEDAISLNKLFKWDSENDKFKNVTVLSNTIENLANLKGVSINDLTLEMENRKKVIDYLVENDISSLEDIYIILSKYYLNPKSLLNELRL